VKTVQSEFSQTLRPFLLHKNGSSSQLTADTCCHCARVLSVQ